MAVNKNFFLFLAIVLLYSCTTKPIETVKDRTWEGQIYRIDDNKQLSDVFLKIHNDTLFIFSNAIFGANNDTLTLVKHNALDTSFVFKNQEGETVKFIYSYKREEKTERLYLEGDDFYVVLGPCVFDIDSLDVSSLYKNISVPRNAYMYLDGAYEGIVEFENQMVDMFSLFSMGPLKIKFVFKDDFKVKVFGSSFWGGGTEIQTYTVSGDRIFIKPKKGKGKKKGKFQTEGFRVVDNGNKLVLQTDGANIVMNKIY